MQSQGPNTVPKVTLPVFFVLDVSGSMTGQRIDWLNRALNDASVEMRKAARQHSEYDIRAAVIAYSTDVAWVTKDPLGNPALVGVEDLALSRLAAGGLTSAGAAIGELQRTMTRDFLFPNGVCGSSIIVMLCDGFATDDWEVELILAMASNGWFLNSVRITVAVGDRVDKDMLARIAGDVEGTPRPDAVLDANIQDVAFLSKLVHALLNSFVAVSEGNCTTDSSVMADMVVALTREELAVESVPDVRADPNTQFCAHCGSRCKAGDAFCVHCGNPLGEWVS